jgi:tripartite-type tricarboxylate transporter receptor subunit TctC
MGEQGHAFESVGWFGVFAPAATPQPIIQRLSEEINRIHAHPEMAAKMEFLNVGQPQAKTPEQFRSVIAKDLQTWKKVVTDAGITLDS